MTDRDRRNKKKAPKRKGSWGHVQTIEDPKSRVALVLSERIRGKPEHSIQIVHMDQMGMNNHIPVKPEGAEHELKDIVYSLVARAQEIVAEREAAHEKKAQDK